MIRPPTPHLCASGSMSASANWWWRPRARGGQGPRELYHSEFERHLDRHDDGYRDPVDQGEPESPFLHGRDGTAYQKSAAVHDALECAKSAGHTPRDAAQGPGAVQAHADQTVSQCATLAA